MYIVYMSKTNIYIYNWEDAEFLSITKYLDVRIQIYIKHFKQLFNM